MNQSETKLLARTVTGAKRGKTCSQCKAWNLCLLRNNTVKSRVNVEPGDAECGKTGNWWKVQKVISQMVFLFLFIQLSNFPCFCNVQRKNVIKRCDFFETLVGNERQTFWHFHYNRKNRSTTYMLTVRSIIPSRTRWIEHEGFFCVNFGLA